MFGSQAEMLRVLEASAPVVVQEFTGRVVGVADGDTTSVRGHCKVRLREINSLDHSLMRGEGK